MLDLSALCSKPQKYRLSPRTPRSITTREALISLDEPKALLPGLSSSRGRICSTIIIHATVVARLVAVRGRLLCFARTEACEQHDEHSEEQQDHGDQTRPHASGVVGVRDMVAVDVILNDLFDMSVLQSKGPPRRRRRRTPNKLKSIAITTSVKIHASAATIAPSRDPTTPAPQLRAKAMKATPQAIGCRIIAPVRPLTVSDADLLNSVPSTADMMSAGL